MSPATDNLPCYLARQRERIAEARTYAPGSDDRELLRRILWRVHRELVRPELLRRHPQ